MRFLDLMNGLFKTKETFPEMTWTSEYNNYGGSFVTITIPVTDENANLLIQAQQMFEPAPQTGDYNYNY